ncbi:NRDE family protein [Luteolibacter algae]|uniref:NRDE family protein n=1 Tax=Luteolibacter algae TaxID=454151 RepID=A0ABW5D928_9BACT
MCTISWKTDSNGSRRVYFNRDELKSRPVAIPPQKFSSTNEVAYLAPIDPAGGGTWMAVNERGVMIALLNRWHEKVKLHGRKLSRGEIVLSLADCKSVEEAEVRIHSRDLGCFLAFTIVLSDHHSFSIFAWDGKRLVREDLHSPITSSSFAFPEVKCFREAALANGDVRRVHAGVDIIPSAYTVRMNRPDAQTWSRSEITFLEKSVIWDYWEEMPDLSGEPTHYRASLTLKPNHSDHGAISVL